jgi:serine phosphatase RsbU (regulator of sigma subunit)
MNVYLIGKNHPRAKKLKLLLDKNSIPSELIAGSRLNAGGKGIFIIFAPQQLAPHVVGKLGQLITGGNLVLGLFENKLTRPSLPGIIVIPEAIDDRSLISFIVMVLGWKDKEDHLYWITMELEKVNKSLEAETRRLKQTRDELNKKNKKMTEELALANIIQNSFLPKQFPASVPMSFTHKYIPHEYIGGDFYEIHAIDDTHLGILIADVSGHGVSSALITAMLKSSFAHAATGCLSPSKVLSIINKEFTHIMRTDHYITAFYSIFDTANLAARFANAGHPRQLVLRQDGRIEFIGANGFFLGMFDNTDYEENSIKLEAGDRMVFYTDGIIECPDTQGQFFGKENLVRVIENHQHEDIESLSKSIIVELIAYMADYRFPDDITLLIAELIPLL